MNSEDDPLDHEIDFSKGHPNPYFVAYHGPKVIRVLDADLADIFPENASVNAALRTIAEAAKQVAECRNGGSERSMRNDER